jgi:hypothetical protein
MNDHANDNAKQAGERSPPSKSIKMVLYESVKCVKRIQEIAATLGLIHAAKQTSQTTQEQRKGGQRPVDFTVLFNAHTLMPKVNMADSRRKSSVFHNRKTAK